MEIPSTTPHTPHTPHYQPPAEWEGCHPWRYCADAQRRLWEVMRRVGEDGATWMARKRRNLEKGIPFHETPDNQEDLRPWLRSFIEQGADPNRLNEDASQSDHASAPIHLAARLNRPGWIEAFAYAKADLGLKSANGMSAANFAVREDSIAVVQCLRAVGYDFRIDQGRHGGTLLHMAADFNASACLAELLDFGLDPNQPDSRQDRAVHNAYHNAQMLSILHSYGAGLELPGNDGDRVIHLVVDDGKADALRFLLAQGVSIDEPDHFGRIPRHAALEKPAIADVMRSYLAAENARNILEEISGLPGLNPLR